MASSGAGVNQIRIGKEWHGYVYQQVPPDKMEVKEQDVAELWIGTRGLKPGRSEKLVLVKKRNGVVEAVNMHVRSLVKNGLDGSGRTIAVLGEGCTDILLFSKDNVIWWFEPVCGENPLKPGTYQWRSRDWEGKGSYTTTEVTAEERDGRKRRRLEQQRIVAPQKVLFSEGKELQFTLFGTVESWGD